MLNVRDMVLVTPLVVIADTVMPFPDRMVFPSGSIHLRRGTLSLVATHCRVSELPAATGLLAEAVIFRVCSRSVYVHVRDL